MQETEQQFRATAQIGKAMIEQMAHLGRMSRNGVRKGILDMTMAVLFRVQLRCILGQRLDNNLRMLEQVAERLFAGMNGRMITDQYETPDSRVSPVG